MPASSSTLESKEEEGPASRVHKELAPIPLSRLAYVTVAQGLGRGEAEGKLCPPLKCQTPCDWLQGLRPGRGLVIAEGLKGG